jgi:hypothetical protein
MVGVCCVTLRWSSPVVRSLCWKQTLCWPKQTAGWQLWLHGPANTLPVCSISPICPRYSAHQHQAASQAARVLLLLAGGLHLAAVMAAGLALHYPAVAKQQSRQQGLQQLLTACSKCAVWCWITANPCWGGAASPRAALLGRLQQQHNLRMAGAAKPSWSLNQFECMLSAALCLWPTRFMPLSPPEV